MQKVGNKIARNDSLSNIHKSEITDHVAHKNHVIGSDEAKVLGTEEDKYKR